MYINGYEILITAPNEGLLYLPLIRSRVPVAWQGLSIKTDPADEDYGCVMAGEVAMQGSQTGAISNDLYRQVMALLTQGPGSFSGKFGEAVKLISAQGDSLKQGLPINWALSKGALDAGKKGYEEWQQRTTSFFEKDGGTVPPEIASILAQMQTQQDDLARLSSCVVQNIPTTGGGGDAASLRLKTAFFACELTEADKDLMAGLEEKVEEKERELRKIFWPTYESRLFEPIPYETVTLYEMSSWEDEEDELGNITIKVFNIGESELFESDASDCGALPDLPPTLTPQQIQEMYYIRILGVDMSQCPPNYKGKTTYTSPAKIPRNKAYYWDKLLEKQKNGLIPKLLSETNVQAINAKNFKGIVIDDDWIKVCPKHAPYKGQTFEHHHIDRLNTAVGLPQKFHKDYFKQLHWADDVLNKLGKYCEEKNYQIIKAGYLRKG